MTQANNEASRAGRLRRVRYLGLGGLILLALIALVAWGNGARPSPDDTTPPNRLGPADAPVQIVEYGDFGCPACRDWHSRGIKEQLLATYGDQISFEFRHFPVITAQSPQAAEAAQCAAEQGRFWEYHDYLYETAAPGALNNADLKAYAAAVGLEAERFATCLDDGRFAGQVQRDWRAAQRAGARGTPTFFVNGRQAFPTYNGLAEAIEAELGN